jgi:hypothetical protein
MTGQTSRFKQRFQRDFVRGVCPLHMLCYGHSGPNHYVPPLSSALTWVLALPKSMRPA